MSKLRLVFVLFSLFSVIAGCGPDTKKDLCDGVDCEFGVCDGDSGTCVNPRECSDTAPCLEGFECIEGSCAAMFDCSGSGTCDRGVCEAGACVNPDRCEVDGDCVPGYGCDGDQCIVDECDLIECDRGVCEKSTGECVNSAVCTVESEESDCIEGYVCYDQSCADEETVCADLDCQRGTCSFSDFECINPDSCSDDLECLEGYFCDDAGACQQNVCDANGTTCARGVCDRATGDCVNADTCTAFDDCTDGFFCIGDTCTDATTACDVCPGNQVCDYDQGALDVVCSENPDGCVTTIDCSDARTCQDGTCGDPAPCTDDDFEPNDSEVAATDWFTVSAMGAPLSASICQGDADWYSYDVTEDSVFTGTLVVVVDIPAEQVGIADLAIELFDPSGASVGQTGLLANESSARLEYSVGNIDQGVYQVSVQEESDVGTGGIDYEIYVDLVDENAAAACAAPMELAMDGSGDTSMSMSNALGSACTFDATSTEDVWVIDVTEPAWVEVTLDSNGWDGVLSLRRQCESDPSEVECANDTIGAGSELLGARLDPGNYYVIVQGNAGSEAGAYDISVTQEPVICGPADNACADATTAMICNPQGTAFDMETCALGCDMATGACTRAAGDVCSTALDANGGYTGTVSLGSLENDYDPASPACVPDSFGDSVTVGPDAVFNLTLAADEVVYVQADPVSFDDLSLYIVDDCADVGTACISGINDNEFSGPEEIVYQNTTGAAQDLWVILDSESLATSDVDVEILTGPVVCTPGEQQCNGDDLETCNVAGTGYDGRTCNFGCDAGTVDCVPPPNDMCTAGAIDVSAGGTFTGTIDDYNNDYSDPSVCTGYNANGADAVYTYTGTVGDIVTVTLDTPYDASLYAVSDCGDIFSTCLAGSDVVGQPEEIEFVVESTDPIFIIADAFSSSPSGDYTLTVSSRSPDCTTYGDPVMCQADGMTLQYCNQLGEYADYTCASTCSGAACDMPAGDRCFDAIALNAATDTFTGSFSDFEADIDPGVGTCILSEGLTQTGVDAVFELQLTVGDLLTADLTTTNFGAGMYILTDCGDASDACAWAAPQQDQLQFYAPTSGTYYLVVDTTSFTATEDFTLDVSTQAGFACQPAAYTCDSVGGTLNDCNDSGTAIDNVINCTNGCRSNGYCNAPTTAPDTCTDATLVTGPMRFFDNHSRYADDYDPGAVANTCDLTDTDGPDLVYEVPVTANQVIDVTVDDLGASGSPVIYFATDCADVANTCLGSATDFTTVRAGYIATASQTVYVFVDHTAAADSPLVVDIDVRASQCAPNSQSCVSPDQREYCNDFGELVSEDCFFGCTGGVCDPPTNDTCSMPYDITAGGTYTLDISGFANDYDPAATGTSCTGYAAEGPDAVFQFTGQKDDVVTVKLGSDDYDTSLYITTTCADTTTCVAGADDVFTAGTEEINFVVPSTGDYYVIADSFTPSPTGQFTLELSAQTPICTPNSTTCDAGGQNIDVCDDVGLTTQSVACDASGCVPGESFCATRDGERCVEAIDATAGGQFMGDYANFTDDYFDDGFNSCTGSQTPGTDAAYFVDLTAGQALTATLNSPNVDSALYVVRNCTDTVGSCLDGEDLIGTDESVTYTATGDERVFIIVDAFDAGPTGAYTLDVMIN
jgi:hypothetical protein